MGPTKDKDKRKRTSLLNLGFPSKLIPSKVELFYFYFLFPIKNSILMTADLPTYLHIYLPTYLRTHIPAYLPTYTYTCLPTYLPSTYTYLPTYLSPYPPTYLGSAPGGSWR